MLGFSRRSSLAGLLVLVLAGALLFWWGRRSGDGAHTGEPYDLGGRPFRLLELVSEQRGRLAQQRMGLGGQSRKSLIGTLPYSFSSRFRVPEDGRLWFGLSRARGAGSSASVSIAARSEDGPEVLFQTELDTDVDGWRDFSVDLAAFGGGEVQLDFRAEGADDETRVAWSNLYVGPAESERPNVFVVLIDTLRPDHLGCYGYERATSPVIDSLADEGVRFDNAFSAAPWTDPAILALLTGLYPSDAWEPGNQATTMKKVLPRDIETLADAFARAGYYTVAASDHPGIRSVRFGQGFDVFGHLFAAAGEYENWRQTPTDLLLGRLRDLVRMGPPSGKLVYVHLIYPHRPYDAPEPFKNMFGPGATSMDPGKRDGLINLYDGEIRRTDGVMGELFAELQSAGLEESSILVLLSDHGEGFWEHGFYDHGNSLYNELLRIPLIIRAPGRLQGGRSVEHPVSIVDVFPTILDLADIAPAGPLRGRSLVPLMADGAVSERLILSEFAYQRVIHGRSLQSLDEKLIHPGPDREDQIAFYDLRDDPQETRNLYADEAVADRSARMLEVLSALKGRAPGSHEQIDPPEEMVDALRALGYVE